MAYETHYFSRSAADQDKRCARSRYLSTIAGGIGYSPAGEAPELAFGSCIHKGLEVIWTTGDLDAADAAIQASEHFLVLTEAHQFLVRCLSYAYGLSVYPRLKKYWRLVAAEAEVSYTLVEGDPHIFNWQPAVILLAQPDLLLEHIELGIHMYVEAKSTKLLTDRYLRSWTKNVQLAAGKLAVKQTLGIDIDAYTIQLFYKGEAGDDYWRSPFTSAWRRPVVLSGGAGDPPADYQEDYEYAPKRPTSWKGWERFDVYTSGVTPRAWVEQLQVMDSLILASQLPTVEVALDPELVRRWERQLRLREAEIARFTQAYEPEIFGAENANFEAVLDDLFPQNFSACEPAMGISCPFVNLCWHPTAARNPLAHGYQQRTPHHETERVAWEGRLSGFATGGMTQVS